VQNLRKVPLAYNELESIQTADKLLKKSFPVKRMILFGSKTRGEADEHSDIDILIICSRVLNWKEEKELSGMLFDIGIEYDVIFSPLFTTENEFNGGIFTYFPIYNEIVNTGATVL
jgi:uncharacterized protein